MKDAAQMMQDWDIAGAVRRSMLIAAFLASIWSSPAGALPSESAAQKPAAKADSPLSMFGDDDFGKLPTYVKSDSLTLKGAERTFAYQGNVEVRQGDMTLTAATVDGKYNELNQIEGMTAHDNVVIVKGENIRASGDRAIFENATQVITLTENPELQQEGSVLTADQIKVFLKENRSVAEGNVRVKLVKKPDSGDVSVRKNLSPLGR